MRGTASPGTNNKTVSQRSSNDLLRHQRLQRGWTQDDVADRLYKLCLTDGQRRKRGDINANMISRWECGKVPPSAFWQAKLLQLYGVQAEELGFLEPLPQQREPLPIEAFSSLPSRETQEGMVIVSSSELTRVVQVLCEAKVLSPKLQTETWLTLGVDHLMHLFDEGWSVEDIITALQAVLQGAQAMSKINRRHLLQLGAAAIVGGITIPTSSHISAEDRVQLCEALGSSIAAGWNLFHTASNAQVLAVGQAQLFLIQQASQHLYPGIRPIFYSSAFNLIGAAYHFQGQYNDAYKAHEQAYTAALEAMDVLSMAQSRAWQANGLREQQQYTEALQTIEAASRLVSQQKDTEGIRLQAHFLASSAEMAALLRNDSLHQQYLDASHSVLEQLPYEYNDEFDHTSWHQYRGTCALILNYNNTAVVELQKAIDSLPPRSVIRHITTLMPLAIAYAREGNRDRCVESIKRATLTLKIINSPALNKQFVDYIQQEIIGLFAGDRDIQEFAYEAQQQIAPSAISVFTG